MSRAAVRSARSLTLPLRPDPIHDFLGDFARPSPAASKQGPAHGELRRCPVCGLQVAISDPGNGCLPWLKEHGGGKIYRGTPVRCTGSLTTAPARESVGLRGGL